MNNQKFSPFGIDLDNIAQSIDDFINNTKINDIFGSDCTAKSPAVNVIEFEDHLELEVAAPGLDKSDFNLSVEGDMLTIEATGEAKTYSDNVKIKRKEFNYSTFKRTFRLTDSFDAQRISAKYKKGILLVTVPRKKDEQKDTINIEVF
ncbi:MAG: Hsp20/alpha crystallin family protein [Aureispira sp.]|nr:Hsp20/alpha crystallin family protein [Aureispira sp.]